jgi:hypothetical protein
MDVSMDQPLINLSKSAYIPKKTTNENPKIEKKNHSKKKHMFPETDPELQIVQPSRLDAPGHGILVPQRHRGLAGLAWHGDGENDGKMMENPWENTM